MQIKQILIFVLLTQSVWVAAQKKTGTFELGAAIAAFTYQGDLTPEAIGSFKTMKPGFVLSASKIFTPSMALRLQIIAGSIKGDEAKYKQPEYRSHRAFSFRSPVVEVSPQLVWNVFGTNNSDRRDLSPYLFAGGTLSYFNLKPDSAYFGDGSDIPARLATDEQKKLTKLKFTIPAGAGIRYNLSHRLALTGELSYHFPFTDYLDGFSKSVNPHKGDHYFITAIGFVFRFGVQDKLGCPTPAD
ncbi:MAG TPA: DUF6089 family protein [Chitinophagaceae bacterium]|nr:DUF6089 family protein [Chitinophagaceae bacterium]